MGFSSFLVLDFLQNGKKKLFIFKVMHSLCKRSNSIKVKKVLIFICQSFYPPLAKDTAGNSLVHTLPDFTCVYSCMCMCVLTYYM